MCFCLALAWDLQPNLSDHHDMASSNMSFDTRRISRQVFSEIGTKEITKGRDTHADFWTDRHEDHKGRSHSHSHSPCPHRSRTPFPFTKPYETIKSQTIATIKWDANKVGHVRVHALALLESSGEEGRKEKNIRRHVLHRPIASPSLFLADKEECSV